MERWLEHFARANFRRSADTAHDLKTPLNVAVLNLELVRMRLRKLGHEEDEKLVAYARAIELELRRLGNIFDAFFLLSTPPKGDDRPAPIDIAAICRSYVQGADGQAFVTAHEPRIREACKLFFEGAAKVLGGLDQSATIEDGRYVASVSGTPLAEEFEPTRIFKFYYTDPQGNPDLSLAVARLIAETYGGELNAVEESGKVTLKLSFPLGAE